MPLRRIAGPFIVTFLLGGLYGSPAWAEGKPPSKIDCIAADTDGQSLRLENKLGAARTHFTVCASARCPKIVRDDCLQRIDEVEKAQPTVIFSATNGNGRPVVMVQVFMDGALVAERLDGEPLPIDPGDHVFTFKALGRTDAEMKLSIHEGERERHGVVLRTASAIPAAAEQAPSVADVSTAVSAPPKLAASSTPDTNIAWSARPEISAASVELNSTTRNLALGVGGAGIVALGVGSVFGIITMSNWNAAQRACGQACPANSMGQREERSASSDGTISTVAFVAGGAALAAGVILWLVTPEPSSLRTGMRIVPRVSAGRGEIDLESKF
jgi:hypothetical protein